MEGGGEEEHCYHQKQEGRGGGGFLSSQCGGSGGASALSVREWGILTSSWTGRTPAIEDNNGTKLN